MSWKRSLEKQIRADHRRAAREHLAKLRDELKHARAARKAALCRARGQCKADRLAVRARLQAKRARIMAQLVRVSAQQREAARKECAKQLAAAKAISDRVARARAELAAERQFRREMKVIAQSNKARAKEHKRPTAAERRAESDDEVLANIPESYAALWERVKKGIKGNARKSRTEAFMQYAEENPHELLESVDDATERLVRQLEERERAAAKAARKRPAREHFVDVPF